MNTKKIREYIELMRLKALGMSTIAVFGALSINGSLQISHFLQLFFIGIVFNVLGFVLNDYIDFDTDKKSMYSFERPLVKETISRKAALIISILCYIIIFTAAFIFFRDFFPMLLLSIAVILGTIYDCFGKKFIGADIPLAGSIAFFCLFGAATISHNIGGLTIIISCLLFTHVLFFNIIEGGLKDVHNDRKTGAKTIAVFLGVKTDNPLIIPKTFKVIAISLELSSAILIFLPFFIIPKLITFDFWFVPLTILVVLEIKILYEVIKMLNIRSFDRAHVTHIIGEQEVRRYMTVPLILLGFAGIIWAVFLIFLPIIWYLTFVFILQDKILSNPKSFGRIL